MKRVTNIRVVTPIEQRPRDLMIGDDGRILALVDPTDREPADCEIVDGGGLTAFPGMLDLLTHGFGEYLYSDAEPGCVAGAAQAVVRHGVTGFAPSVTTMTLAALCPTLRELAAQARAAEGSGARVLGLHSEGPCFGSAGAHKPEWLQTPSVALAEALIEAGDGMLLFTTLAAELPHSEAFARSLIAAGVKVHFGHSCAPAEAIPRYADWGLNAVTHMYDVFTPAPVVEPGRYPFSLADACLAEPRLCLGLICDGVHALPQQVRLLAQLSLDRVFLETDSMKYTGLPPGEFELYAGMSVRTTLDNAARDTATGTLAGSCITSDRALRNWVQWSGYDLPRASHAASLNPARLAGREADLGSLEPGKFADFILLDAALEVQATFVGGACVYRR